jgi:type II secretory pathway pseudopilin PulG
MPTDRNVDYSLIYVLLAVVVIAVLSIVGSRVIKPAMNNLQKDIALQEFETAFESVQHAAGTERLSLRTAAGDFTDSERGCDFFVGQVRAYDGDQEAVRAAYADQNVEGIPVQVLFVEDGQMPAQLSQSLPESLDGLAGWELAPNAAQQPLYVVYLLVAGYEGNMSLDCRQGKNG